MSKSSTLKIKSLFRKTKSPDKENKEFAELNVKHSSNFRDGELGSPEDRSTTLPASPPGFRHGDTTSPGNILPTSPKEKKVKRLLSFKLRKKKSKDTAGGDLFLNDTDELDSINSQM